MNEQVMNKIDELMEDSMFCEEMKNAKDFNEMVDIFANHGVDITVEEIKELHKGLSTVIESANGEMTENDLENVSGGCIISWLSGYFDRVRGKARQRSGWHVFYNWGYSKADRDQTKTNDVLHNE